MGPSPAVAPPKEPPAAPEPPEASRPKPAAAPEPKAGDIIAGRYRVRAVLGRTHGLLIDADQLIGGQRVVVCILSKAIVEPGSLRAFLHDLHAFARLHSPHVARVLDIGELPDGSSYYAREYAAGKTYSEYARSGLSIAAATELFLQVCHAVQAAHRQGVVIRDLQAGHVYVASDADGKLAAKVTDFGVCRAMKRKQGSPASCSKPLGLSICASPELIDHHDQVDARADVWSLGCLLYQVVASTAAFRGEGAALMLDITSCAPLMPSSMRWDIEIPVELDRLIMAALQRDRDARPPTPHALASGLRPFVNEPGAALMDQIAHLAGVQVAPLPVAAAAALPQQRATLPQGAAAVGAAPPAALAQAAPSPMVPQQPVNVPQCATAPNPRPQLATLQQVAATASAPQQPVVQAEPAPAPQQQYIPAAAQPQALPAQRSAQMLATLPQGGHGAEAFQQARAQAAQMAPPQQQQPAPSPTVPQQPAIPHQSAQASTPQPHRATLPQGVPAPLSRPHMVTRPGPMAGGQQLPAPAHIAAVPAPQHPGAPNAYYASQPYGSSQAIPPPAPTDGSDPFALVVSASVADAKKRVRTSSALLRAERMRNAPMPTTLPPAAMQYSARGRTWNRWIGGTLAAITLTAVAMLVMVAISATEQVAQTQAVLSLPTPAQVTANVKPVPEVAPPSAAIGTDSATDDADAQDAAEPDEPAKPASESSKKAVAEAPAKAKAKRSARAKRPTKAKRSARAKRRSPRKAAAASKRRASKPRKRARRRGGSQFLKTLAKMKRDKRRAKAKAKRRSSKRRSTKKSKKRRRRR